MRESALPFVLHTSTRQYRIHAVFFFDCVIPFYHFTVPPMISFRSSIDASRSAIGSSAMSMNRGRGGGGRGGERDRRIVGEIMAFDFRGSGNIYEERGIGRWTRKRARAAAIRRRELRMLE